MGKFRNLLKSISSSGRSRYLVPPNPDLDRNGIPKKTVLVWDGKKFHPVSEDALTNDGFRHKGKVVHHRNRRINDSSNTNLVLISKEEHFLLHLVEDRYDIERNCRSTPTVLQMKEYAKLKPFCKNRRRLEKTD